MGTSSFAVPIAEKLILNNDFEVVAIFTVQPKATGRGLEIVPSPIDKLATKYSITTYTPKTLKSEESYDLINKIEADVIIVASYGLIIPEKILNIKKYGCLNIHPSILPKYRGAAPLQWTIINGDKETGVCIMQMDAGIDTGDILLQKNFPLSQNIQFQELHDVCSELGASLIIEALQKIPSLKAIKQTENGASYARKLTKNDGLISWLDSVHTIDCKIRGMNPWPGSYFKYNNKIIKILEADCIVENHSFPAGTIVDDMFTISCSNGLIKIKSLQPEGKKVMTLRQFLNGNIIKPNDTLY